MQMYFCVVNPGKLVTSLKEMCLLKRREFDVYKVLRELNLMNAIELLMKQHYSENFFFFAIIRKHIHAQFQYLLFIKYLYIR